MRTISDEQSNLGDEKTILLVDDSYVNRAKMEKVFSSDYHVLHAKDGIEALEVLHTQPINAVLLDLVMPKLDGYGVLLEMRKDKALAQIPVIVITGYNDNEHLNKALDCGAQDVIGKPFAPGILLKRVGNLISLHDAMRAVHNNEQQRDGLTGLLNRTAFAAQARKLLFGKPADSYVISCLDIDYFKAINDRFGHDAGNDLLLFIANTLCEEVRPFGGLACRDMADTFFSLLPNDQTALNAVAEHFFEEIAFYPLPTSIDAHIGQYTIDDPSIDVNLMLDRALMAVRSIKGSAEKRLAHFSEDMRLAMLRQKELENDMRSALAAEQFTVYFQPQYNYVTGAITGAEALARWHHPQKGMIMPGEFIPLFERNGFITQLDQYIWESACRYLRQWMDEGIAPASVSVNISRQDFRALDPTQVIPNLIQKYGLSPKQLHLEITESAYLGNPQELIKAVEDLKALGFAVEMDDFGAGYSSLSILKDVPVDILKLDMKFISQGKDSSRGGSILSSVIRMAHWLKLPVIAEGVETKQQADYLKSIGCSLMQGFYFSKPMPPEEGLRSLFRTKKLADQQFALVGTDIQGAADFFDASSQSTLLFNSFVGGAAIAEFDGTQIEFLRMNDRFFNEIGYTEDEYRRTELNIFSHLDDASKAIGKAALLRAIQTGDETTCELRSLPLLPGKKALWVRTHIRFLAQNVGRFVFYILLENITEKKELAAAKQSLADELSGILSCVPGGIMKTEIENGKFNVVFVSESFAKILGYPAGELQALLNSAVLFGIHPDDRERVMTTMTEAVAFGRDFECQYRLKHADGHYVWVSLLDTYAAQPDGRAFLYASLTNISSIKAMEEKQKELGDELNDIISSVPGGIIKSYVSGDQIEATYVSDGMATMTGYSIDQWKQDTHNNYIWAMNPEDIPQAMAVITPAIANKADYEVRYRIRHRDGHDIWVNVKSHYTRATGKKGFYYTTITDITALIEAEAQRKELAGELDGIMKNVPSGIFELKYQGDHFEAVFISDSFAHILGFQPAAFRSYINCDLLFGVHPEDSERIRALLAGVLKTSGSMECQYRLKHSDGHYIWVEAHNRIVRQADGSIVMYASVADISARKKLESSLDEKSLQADALIANAPGGVISLCVDAAGTHLEFFSDGLCRMLGYSREETAALYYPDVTRLVHPDDRLRINAAAAEATRTLSAFNEDYRLLHKSGSYIWINLTANPVLREDGSIRFYGSYADITQHIKNEEALRTENHRNRLFIEQNQLAIYDYSYDTDTLILETHYAGKGYVMVRFPDYSQYLKTSNLVAPGSVALVQELIASARRDPSSGTAEFQANLWGSGYCWARNSYSATTDEAGKVTHLVGLISNIEEEKRREALLRQLSSSMGNSPIYEPNLIADVFAYLNAEKNTDTAIHHSLSVVGSYFHISRIYIYENSDDGKFSASTFQWSSAGISPKKEGLHHISGVECFGYQFPEQFDDNGRLLCTDPRQLPPPARDFLVAHGIRAILQWKLYHSGKFSGIIGFDDCIGAHNWTPAQVGTLSLLSNIIGLYLSRKRDQEDSLIAGDFRDSMDKNTAYITIVDPETDEIIYANPAYEQAFGRRKVRVPCYVQAMSKSGRCATCPIAAYKDNGKSVQVELQRPDGIWLLSKSSPLLLNGHEVFMITYMDITPQKNAAAKHHHAKESDDVLHLSRKYLVRYDIATGTATNALDAFSLFGAPQTVEHYEDYLMESGLILPDSVDLLRQFFRALRQGKPFDAFQLHLRCVDGEERWYHVDSITAYLAGRPDHAIISFDDMTQ